MGGLSSAAHASFISQDIFATNDNLGVLDTQTGLQWLSLTATSGKSVNEVTSLLNADYLGMRLATESEVLGLMYNYFPQTDGRTSGYLSNQPVGEVQSFINVFGNSGLPATAYGLHMNSFGMVSMSGVYNGGSYGNINTSNFTSSSLDFSEYYYSSWLVVDDSVDPIDPVEPENPEQPTQVPLPATGGLLALALAGVSFRRKSS